MRLWPANLGPAAEADCAGWLLDGSEEPPHAASPRAKAAVVTVAAVVFAILTRVLPSRLKRVGGLRSYGCRARGSRTWLIVSVEWW
ncbi:hypothetical protein GCM10010149_60780 [Nonomuraea roseoviolacea subsp. roseoviolacea]